MLINSSEKEDFENSLKEFGYNSEDFELREDDQTVSHEHTISPVQGKITVRNKKAGKEKTYDAGHLSTWPSEVHTDLENGYFN